MKLNLAFNMLQNMGVRYAGYRVFHEVEKRAGLLKKKHPSNPETKSFINLDQWRKSPNTFIIDEREKLIFRKNPTATLEIKARKILAGEVYFFNHEWKGLGTSYDWITNPVTGYQYDINKHWSEINDFNPANGDIKDLWEKSRFCWILTLMRYDYHFEKENSEFIFESIEDWIDRNPVNQGPNWKCSQEISLRVFNWCYALTFYRNSPALTTERWEKIQNTIYWSLHHVYNHIDFSRIAVRNNHALTETLCLSVSELLFPFIPETKIWAVKGRKWFEKEIQYQIYEDGTFLQFSMNYHRVVIQLLSLGLSISEKHQHYFTTRVYERAYKSLDFLYQCVQEENGFVPNYGNNDGALFFPLTDNEFRDYRPQLNTLHKILTGHQLYEESSISEDSLWVGSTNSNLRKFPALMKKSGPLSYPNGGFYLLRENDSFTFIRCGNHNDRPAQADNLHLDIWKKGVNILKDSGTYKYNTTKNFQNYFFGTRSHNTVRIGEESQMLKGNRFVWFFWTQSKFAGWEEKQDKYIFKGAISAFRQLDPKIIHQREIVKSKDADIWEISDEVTGHADRSCFQQWHYSKSEDVDISAINSASQIVSPNKTFSFYSLYYGEKIKGEGVDFEFKDRIKTRIKI
jgi:hypothetical protein